MYRTAKCLFIWGNIEGIHLHTKSRERNNDDSNSELRGGQHDHRIHYRISALSLSYIHLISVVYLFIQKDFPWFTTSHMFVYDVHGPGDDVEAEQSWKDWAKKTEQKECGCKWVKWREKKSCHLYIKNIHQNEYHRTHIFSSSTDKIKVQPSSNSLAQNALHIYNSHHSISVYPFPSPNFSFHFCFNSSFLCFSILSHWFTERIFR